ncbi:MAG: DUF4255 domain-containing protein [Bacteroidota bacterium]
MALVQDNVAHLLEGVRAFLQTQLTALLDEQVDTVVLDNIGRPNLDAAPNLIDATVITLVRMEEDASRKAQRNFRTLPPAAAGAPPGIIKRNPPVTLNLYLLITANHTAYSTALLVLSEVIAAFQRFNILTETELNNLPADAVFASRRLKFSLMSPSFEELNHLWGMLGSKQLPSVLYMAQSVEIEYIPDEDITGSPIVDIQLNETIN